MPEKDLATLVRNLTPGALRIFKQQLASLPERDRQVAFSRLSGIPELADIVGRPTPMPAQPPVRKQPEPQTTKQDVPLWQKALQTVGAPFNWIGEHITEPFGAVVTAPFTPGLLGGRQPGESPLAYARRQYEQWQEPTWTMPWGAEFRPTKGIVETLPWFAIPGLGFGAAGGARAAGLLGRLGTAGKIAGTAVEKGGLKAAEELAARGGAWGKAAGVAAKAVRPLAAAEALPGKIIGGAVKKIISKPVTKKVWRAETGEPSLRVSKAYALVKEMAELEPSPGKRAPKFRVVESEVTLKNPLVVKGLQGDLLDTWAKQGDKAASYLVSIADKAEKPPPGWYIEADNYIAQKASALGYDGIFYDAGQRAELTVIDKLAAANLKREPGKIMAEQQRLALEGKVTYLTREIRAQQKLIEVSPSTGGDVRFIDSLKADLDEMVALRNEANRELQSLSEKVTPASEVVITAAGVGEELQAQMMRERDIVRGFVEGLEAVGRGEVSYKEFRPFIQRMKGEIDQYRAWVNSRPMLKGLEVLEGAPGIEVSGFVRQGLDLEGLLANLEAKGAFDISDLPRWRAMLQNTDAFIDSAVMVRAGELPFRHVGGIPKVTSELFPAGLPEPQAAATKWLTDLTRKSKPLTKETLELRKPEHAARAAEYEKRLQEKIAKGVPVKQAEEEATQALYDAYSKAPLTPAFLEQLKEQGKYEATLLRMIADANFKYGFERKNAFTAFWDLLNEGHLQMNQIQTLERVFGSELAKALLEKHRTLGQKIWFNVIDAINIPRGLLSMADLSGFGRQGWILTTTRPDIAVKAAKPMIKAMFSEKNAMFLDDVFLNRKHIDKVLKLRPDFLTKWAGEATDIVAREEGFASRWLNKFPLVGRVYKGSTRAYTTVLNDLRTANVSAAISDWEKNGFKYLSPDEAARMFGDNAKAIFDAKFYTDVDIDLLARTVSWASGRGSLPTELARHAGIANAVLFAPKLIASRVEFPFAVLPGVNPSRLARREAARELLSFIGVGGGLLAMAKLSRQGEVELDPRSPDFGKLKVGDTRLDIWTGYAQYLRFIAQMATAQGKTESGRITTKNRGELVGRFAQSKLSPAAGFITDLVKGETYLGEDMPPRSRRSIQGQIYNRMMPLAIQDLVDGYLEDSWSGGLLASSSFFGVGAVTYTDEVKRTRDRVAQKEFGMSWDEVGTKYGRATQLKLEQTPTIIEAEQEHEERFSGGTKTSMDNFRDEGEIIEKTYREDVDNAVREFRATRDGRTFREKIMKVSENRRAAYSLRAKKGEYQDIMAYYNQPIPPDKLVEMNPGDVLRREYYQQMFDPIKMYDEFGNYRFEEANKIEREFVVKFGQQAMDYIEEYQGARWQDKPVELKMLEEAKELLRPYWDITDKVWAMYPKGLQEISDQIRVMEDGTDEQQRMAKRELRKYPMILRARELIIRYKQQMRRYNPDINQAYKMFY